MSDPVVPDTGGGGDTPIPDDNEPKMSEAEKEAHWMLH